mgnify:CR=1 FL=1
MLNLNDININWLLILFRKPMIVMCDIAYANLDSVRMDRICYTIFYNKKMCNWQNSVTIS